MLFSVQNVTSIEDPRDRKKEAKWTCTRIPPLLLNTMSKEQRCTHFDQTRNVDVWRVNQTVSLTHNIINQKEKKQRFFPRDPLWFYQNFFIQQEEFRKGRKQEISMKRTKEFWLLIKINTTMHFGHPEEGTRKWHCG